MIYRKANLTDFQERVNAAPVELALQYPALVRKVIVDLTKRIAIKESRCQQAEIARNYKLCDQLSEDIMELKSEK